MQISLLKDTLHKVMCYLTPFILLSFQLVKESGIAWTCMCGHQHTESQTCFACRHLLKLRVHGIISRPKFFVYFLTYEISFRMFRLPSEQSSEIRIPDIQISALVTESVIKCSHLIFSTGKSHSGWEMMRPWWFQHVDTPPTHFN